MPVMARISITDRLRHIGIRTGLAVLLLGCAAPTMARSPDQWNGQRITHEADALNDATYRLISPFSKTVRLVIDLDAACALDGLTLIAPTVLATPVGTMVTDYAEGTLITGAHVIPVTATAEVSSDGRSTLYYLWGDPSHMDDLLDLIHRDGIAIHLEHDGTSVVDVTISTVRWAEAIQRIQNHCQR